MAKAKQGGKTAKNRHGIVDIPVINRSRLGTKEFPLAVYRGTKDEAGLWIARLRDLPGYLGWGNSEAEAIARLWQEIGDGPVYDVRGMHRLAPTAENIRYVLGQAKRVEAARAEAEGTPNSAFLAATAKKQHVSRTSVDRAMAMNVMWQRLGGAYSYAATLGSEHAANGAAFGANPEAYFENNPERAEYFLARLKFPEARQRLEAVGNLNSGEK